MSAHMTKVHPMNNLVLYSHWHEELELLVMVKGSAKFHVGQEKFVVQSGEMVFIQPNLLHSAIRLQQEEIVFMRCWYTSIFSPVWRMIKFNSSIFFPCS